MAFNFWTDTQAGKDLDEMNQGVRKYMYTTAITGILTVLLLAFSLIKRSK
ncbi:MAG: hypothetical protein ACK5B9_03205 [Flavobacteriia bacterium]|jgi:hypothetical protein